MSLESAERDFGRSTLRIDGRAKVTGRARFPADEPVANPAFGYLVTSPIARGRIRRIDGALTRAAPGVLGVFTYENVGERVRQVGYLMSGGFANSTIRPLASPMIHYGGQIVALVVGDSFAAARDGAHRLRVEYAEDRPAATLDSPGAESVAAHTVSSRVEDIRVGDAEAAFASAAVKLDERYATPTQHHSPMELMATTCVCGTGPSSRSTTRRVSSWA